MRFKNNDFIPTGNGKIVEVNLRFEVEEGSSDTIILKNAAEALSYFSNVMPSHSHVWVKTIEVKE